MIVKYNPTALKQNESKRNQIRSAFLVYILQKLLLITLATAERLRHLEPQACRLMNALRSSRLEKGNDRKVPTSPCYLKFVRIFTGGRPACFKA